VCAHPKRSEIDRKLAVQVVNVKQLAAGYGLGRDAVTRHRAKHLPAFLPALQARADALTLDQLNAEAQRLYLVALDALARAEAGTLASISDDGEVIYAVSSTAVARLLREARAALDLLARLAVAAPSLAPDEPLALAEPEADHALDNRIAAALDRAIARRDPHIEDAIVVADDMASATMSTALVQRDAARSTTVPVDPVSAAAPRARATEVPLDAVEPIQRRDLASLRRGITQASDGEVVDRGTFADPDLIDRDLVQEARDHACAHRDPISPAASAEEIHAMGYQIRDQPVAGPARP
jgi:hypothetical protein